MSQVDLCVGRLPKNLQAATEAALAQLGISASFEWRQCKKQIAEICLLNLASVCLFLKHVAKLEGHDVGSPEWTRFHHLPWWEESIWLPIDFEPPAEPAIKSEGSSIFLGSSQRFRKSH